MIGANQTADRNLNIKAPSRHVKKTAPTKSPGRATIFQRRAVRGQTSMARRDLRQTPDDAIPFWSASLRLARILRDLASSRVVHAR
jgi:hypothetical protein